MAIIIKPKNWKEFQHYKDRSPPWIKLHKSLLDNYEFHSMQLASKALAPCFWLLASEHQEGLIEVNAKKIAWRFRVTEKVIDDVVKELISSGFFESVQNASSLLATRLQDAMPETEAETEAEAETESLSSSDDEQGAGGEPKDKKPKAPPIPYDEIFDLYNEIVGGPPFYRPCVEVRNDERKTAIKRIVKARPKAIEPEWWREYFTRATKNERWMKGSQYKDGTWWKGANFDFLVHKDRMTEIVEAVQ